MPSAAELALQRLLNIALAPLPSTLLVQSLSLSLLSALLPSFTSAPFYEGQFEASGPSSEGQSPIILFPPPVPEFREGFKDKQPPSPEPQQHLRCRSSGLHHGFLRRPPWPLQGSSTVP
ncbi:hypothetical protein AMECASPLE_032435 [Ameca splendens]|uniref:Uncharacterized protein n=1 Tax=Ameca splendens TaxID=208324 RepID=A0ABV0Z4I3_9TELE